MEECGLRCPSSPPPSMTASTPSSRPGPPSASSLRCSLCLPSSWTGRAAAGTPPIFVVVNTGQLAQFAGDSVRKDVMCRGAGWGGTRSLGQGENLYCVVVFILVYFFSQAAAVWTQVEKLPEGKRQRREPDGGRRETINNKVWRGNMVGTVRS